MPNDRKVPAAPASSVVDNPWRALRRHTPARIGLGRAGVSLPTAAQLDFQLAHAQARDAVHRPLDVGLLRDELESLGLESIALHSAATTRPMYLQRPDLGRQLGADSRAQLEALAVPRHAEGRDGPDIAIAVVDGLSALAVQRPDLGRQLGADSRAQLEALAVPRHAEGLDGPDIAVAVVDGLSALAVQRHAVPLIAALRAQPLIAHRSFAPVAVVEQGRVAVGDGIGELLGARLVVVLIGERPGLSSPDSLGIYLTWAPRVGRHDAERNCISNVRPEGLPYAEAAAKLAYLLDEALRRELTGVALKDESGAAGEVLAAPTNFLLGGH